jgi:hypothetical protein
MADAALMFSGGIHDVYYIEACRYLTNRLVFTSEDAQIFYQRFHDQYNNKEFLPNIDELFEILKYSCKTRNIVGCSTSNVFTKINFLLPKLIITQSFSI